MARKSVMYAAKVLEPPYVGVEIGVDKGYHAYDILHDIDMKKLYLIDPYTPYIDGDIKKSIHNQEDRNYVYEEAKKRLSNYDDKIEFVIKQSEDAVNDIPDNLDFVYIDGNHNYEYVKKDIELYWDKIRVGGVLGGHDYWRDHPGVIRAVWMFKKRNKLELHNIGNDWWFVKE